MHCRAPVRIRATLTIAKSLARHSTITLTMDTYTHVPASDESAALEGLPSIEPSKPDADALKATGTTASACKESENAQRQAQRALHVKLRHPVASRLVRMINRLQTSARCKAPCKTRSLTTQNNPCHRVPPRGMKMGPVGFEPTTKGL